MRDSTEKITVLIVDDHPMFRDGLLTGLKVDPNIHVVGQCATGEEALDMARDLEPDVVVLDVQLPDINGLQVARQMKALQLAIHVVVLTGHDDVAQAVYAMRSGAAAYSAKGIASEELVDIIRSVTGGEYVIGGEHMDARGLEHWIHNKLQTLGGPYVVDADEHFIPLSPREMEILQFVTYGLSNKEIAQKLDISQQTVKNHMTSILKKLNVEDRTQAAVHALRYGWVRMDGKDSEE